MRKPRTTGRHLIESLFPSADNVVKAPTKSSRFRGVTLFRPTGKWRAQISAAGKTTSLGDHETEEEAARAFDCAAINKGGFEAVTNFSLEEYGNEVYEIMALSQAELVATLRHRARQSSKRGALALSAVQGGYFRWSGLQIPVQTRKPPSESTSEKSLDSGVKSEYENEDPHLLTPTSRSKDRRTRMRPSRASPA